MKCNMTGIVCETYPFVFRKGDYGYYANHLADMEFTFYLCEQEFVNLLSQGIYRSTIRYEQTDNYALQYETYLSSDLVYETISRFKYVPENWFKQYFPFLNYEGEQWLWEHPEQTIADYAQQLEESAYKGDILGVLDYYTYTII